MMKGAIFIVSPYTLNKYNYMITHENPSHNSYRLLLVFYLGTENLFFLISSPANTILLCLINGDPNSCILLMLSNRIQEYWSPYSKNQHGGLNLNLLRRVNVTQYL